MKINSIKILFILFMVISCAKKEDGKRYAKTWTDSDKAYLQEHLKGSLDSILKEVRPLSEAQFNWKPDDTQWSIAWVVEHLITHDELFYREVTVLSDLPEMKVLNDSLFEEDEGILSYGTVTLQNAGKAPPYLQPLGRWCSKQEALQAYMRTRRFLFTFVETTNKDLRKYYTTSGRGATAYRDLHQLLLISTAHTKRHLAQIQKLKAHPDFPKGQE